MNSEWMCRNCPSRRSGGGSVSRGNCNMMVITVMSCWLALAILTFFPASTIARIIPGTNSPLAETISKQEQMPRTFVSDSNNQDLQLTPQEVNTIFGKYYIKDVSMSRRRGLVGSSPPTCVARCGTCEPCKPVHIAITSPHAVISETDYYPEVWRCECDNQYYMP